MHYFPEEIFSGRAGKGGKRTPESKALKVYVKFAQALRELEAVLPQCTTLPPEAIAAVATPNSKRSAKMPLTLACLPLAPTRAPTASTLARDNALDSAGEEPPASRRFQSPLHSKSRQVLARGRRLAKWGVGIGVTLLRPGATARATGVIIQSMIALVASALHFSVQPPKSRPVGVHSWCALLRKVSTFACRIRRCSWQPRLQLRRPWQRRS